MKHLKELYQEEVRRGKPFYKSPLPRKKQLCTHYRGRSGKVRQFTEEEIFLEKCRRVASKINFLCN